MQEDLLAALRNQHRGEPTAMVKQHLEFALSNRTRGAERLSELESRLGISLAGKKVLDVGSGYGGFVIEAAARGASAWGVEITRKNYDYCRLNAQGEAGDIHFVPGDFVSPEVGAELPRDFDVVLVNDVFEHVYDTAGLLGQLRSVMADGGVFVFSIPNGESVRAVAREGHYGIAGLTLLPPNWWHMLTPSFTAFYRRWSHYSGLFRAFGFNRIAPWNASHRLSLDNARTEIASGLQRAVAAIDALAYRDDKARPALAAALEDYRARLELDLARGDVELLHWRYLTEFWRGCAYKTGPTVADLDDYPPSIAAGTERGRRAERPASAPESVFVDIGLADSPRKLASTWTKRADAEISVGPDYSVRLDVTGSSDTSYGQYGAMVIPIHQPLGALRLELEFLEPQNIHAVYLQGEDARRCQVLRWQWLCKDGGPPSSRRETFLFEPGRSFGPFLSAEPTFPRLVKKLHLFILIRGGTRSGFILHRAQQAVVADR